MERREFVRSALIVGGAYALGKGSGLCMQPSSGLQTPDPEVKRVLVMFKCHFDAGFINTQAAVVSRYFADYFPKAIQVADTMRQSGSQRYVWTTGSWLLYEYLEQASPADVRRMEHAIAAGDIAWHGLPFNWQTELMTSSMILGGIGLSEALDRRFGCRTTGAKMTDVPGHTRGLIAPLAAKGITFLDIGVNGASRPAEVPPLFTWKDSNGATLVVMYHHEYGATTRVPGSDLAVAIVVRGDNSGPHTKEEVGKIYADLANSFPNASITPTNLSNIAAAVQQYKKNLPVVTQEIGDTWIYGVASDPLKMARYREMQRLRQSWLDRGKLTIGNPDDLRLLRRLLLEPEHTWGTDTKTWLDFNHYTPKDLASMLHTKNYEVVQFSWAEKRKDLFEGIATPPSPLREEASAAMHSLEAKEPAPASRPAGKEIQTEHFILGFDPHSGAIIRLRNRKSGREWASITHPLALFSYQTLSEDDYAPFFAAYIISTADWAKKDFGKPNMESFGARSREWTPSLADIRVEENESGHRVLVQLTISDKEAVDSGVAAFPPKLYLELLLPKTEPIIRMNFSWFQKPATRMPEAMWLTFNPVVAGLKGSWTMDKTGERISPSDVVVSGNRHMHAVSTGFQYGDGNEDFVVETLDAPVVAFGKRSPLNFSNSEPDLSGGVHCNLFNNAWGTNYIMWFGEDMRLRFILRA
ncbi:MAG TPA: DUF5054 domain-containing protein [Acidobacteriaceae bacterium]|nr:DUF5054 domain-containing protein [Acidobacteriaceae bacterium]